MAIECGGADFCDLRAILKEDLRRIKVHDRSILAQPAHGPPSAWPTTLPVWWPTTWTGLI